MELTHELTLRDGNLPIIGIDVVYATLTVSYFFNINFAHHAMKKIPCG